MHFKFDAKQEFQLQAIESAAALLEGQPHIPTQLRFTFGFGAIANRLDLSDSALLANLQKIQAQNGIHPADQQLFPITKTVDTAEGKKDIRFLNFSVEMETGTGKTYVYLRTAFELHRRYGLRKFIVVVPSVAVREGVLKTLEITEQHLRSLYDNTPFRYYSYDSANLGQVRQFALSDSIELMVMTIDSFNKAANVIHQTTDRLQGEMPVRLIQATRPLLILDEPQNMESELRVAALATLNPLLALRYSATHRNAYNLIYRLTPYEAYRQGLVKRIEVAGVSQEADENQAFFRLDAIRSRKRTVTASMAVHKLMKTGVIREQSVTVRPGDSLETASNRLEYAKFVVEEIDARNGTVLFTNGIELRTGESRGPDKEAIFDSQIRYTIGEHIRKQRRLKEKGIKVLSLFFIDRVDNYAKRDGVIHQLFEKAFNDLKSHSTFEHLRPSQVQAAYFASRRTKAGELIYEDSRTGDSEKDREAYDLIMRDKERLLSLDEPTCFIFSHSALREGWDSPNVFQICTLNQTASQMKKRQEIGRGVRLAVNQQGDRIRDENVNVLTVIANESYERYVSQYQSEVEVEFGANDLAPRPANARKPGVARLRKQMLLSSEFESLWERIRQKTRYAVKIDSAQLIRDALPQLNKADIRRPQVVVSKARVEAEGEQFVGYHVAEHRESYKTDMQDVPNITELIASLLERTTPPLRLTRTTLLQLFSQCNLSTQKAALANPFEFASVAVAIIKAKVIDQLIDGIQYEKLNEWYEMTQFEDIPSWEEHLVPAKHSIYDQIIYESDSIEKQFVLDLERRSDVRLYVKLPSWFTVPTPIGDYNPDWAIVLEKRDRHGDASGQMLYLVRETKSTRNLEELRPEEKRKILCGERHFKDALQVDYRVATSATEL